MAYSFKNQPTATAQIERNVAGANGTTFKLAGINGEQTNANNFRTAIADFIGIGGIGIASGNEALQRTLNQSVESDGEDLQLTFNPSSFTIEQINTNSGSGSYANISSTIGKSPSINKQLAAAMTLSGKKLVGSTVTVDGNYSEGVSLTIRARSSGGAYTVGEDSATINVHMNSVTINGTKYASADLTFTLQNGVASEFEDIT